MGYRRLTGAARVGVTGWSGTRRPRDNLLWLLRGVRTRAAQRRVWSGPAEEPCDPGDPKQCQGTLGIRNGKEGLEVHAGGEKSRSAAPLAETLPLQVIDPEIHDLIGGGPEGRRRFGRRWAGISTRAPVTGRVSSWRRALPSGLPPT